MKRVQAITCLLLAGLTAGAGDQESKDAAALLAPWFDEQAVAAVHLDVSKLREADVEAVFAKVAELRIPFRRGKDLTELRAPALQWVRGLTNAKAKHVFLIWSLSRPQQPYLVVPLGQGTDRAAVENVLGMLAGVSRDYKVESRDGAVLAGTAGVLNRLRAAQRDGTELARAFAAVGDSTLQVVVQPPAALRKAMLETMPNLPKELGGGPTAQLDRAVVWAAAGVKLAPGSLRLVIQSHDAESASVLREVVGKALVLLRDEAKDLPEVAAILGLLSPRLEKDRLVVSLDDKTVAKILIPLAAKMRLRAERTMSINSLKQFALAMHNYYDVHKSLPAPANYDAQGKPLLSWRVHLLPYVEQNPLYQQFKLDEPWDSRHNKALIAKMPDIYRAPGHKHGAEGKTCYQVPVGKDTIFPGQKGITFKEISDGTSNTILILETNDDQAVIWTKPDDWEFNDKEPLRGLLRPGGDGFHASFADGSVRHIPRDLRPEILRALLTRSGGEVIPDF